MTRRILAIMFLGLVLPSASWADQDDYDVSNTVSGLRGEVNSALDAIQSNNSGSSAPASTKSFQWWVDTSDSNNPRLKVRNKDDDGWIDAGTLSEETLDVFSDKARLNALFNSYRIADNAGSGPLKMFDGVVDAFENENGVDTLLSRAGYDSTGDDYSSSSNDWTTDPVYSSSGVYSPGPYSVANAFDESRDGSNNPISQWASDGSLADPWVSVDFGEPRDIRKAVMYWSYTGRKAGNIQYSDDSSNWSTAQTFDNSSYTANAAEEVTWDDSKGAHRYWRVEITEYVGSTAISLTEFDLMEDGGTDMARTMSLSASSIGSPTGTYQVSGAADDDFNTQWGAVDGTGPEWVQVDLQLARKITMARLYWSYTGLKAGDIQYSDNGSSWTNATSFSDSNYVGQTWMEISFGDVGGHRYWRVNITGYAGSAIITLKEMELLEAGKDLSLVSNTTTAQFEPDKIRLLVFEKDDGVITLNTDLKGWVSCDDGGNWTQVTLVSKGQFSIDPGSSSDGNLFTGVASPTCGAGDDDLKWKVTSANDELIEIHGVAMEWD